MMARAMMWAVECRSTSSASAVPAGQQAELDRFGPAVVQRAVEIDDLPVDHRGDGRLGQPLADPLGHLRGRAPAGYSLIDPSGSLI